MRFGKEKTTISSLWLLVWSLSLFWKMTYTYVFIKKGVPFWARFIYCLNALNTMVNG